MTGTNANPDAPRFYSHSRTPARDDLLMYALDMETRCDFAGVFTGRLHRLSTAKALEANGLLEPILLQVCDGDGCALDPERYRWGWALTNPGRECARQAEEAERRRLCEPSERGGR